MKTSIAIIIALALAATSANNLLAAASTPELSTPELNPRVSQVHREGAFRSLHEAPRR